MSTIIMTSLAKKLQRLCLRVQDGQEAGLGHALREAIVSMDRFMEVEVLKSLGDLHLQKGKLGKDSDEFDKAAALYAAALLRCKDPGMRETLEHRIGYMEKLYRKLPQGYTPNYQWLSPEYWGTADSNVLRVAEICDKLDRSIRKSQQSVEQIYTEMLVTAIEKGDMLLECEVQKSLGDFYLVRGKKNSDISQFSKAAAMYNKALTRCEEPGQKQTLHHRIRYMVKIRGALRKEPSQKNPRLHVREGRSHIGSTLSKRTTMCRSQVQRKAAFMLGFLGKAKEEVEKHKRKSAENKARLKQLEEETRKIQLRPNDTIRHYENNLKDGEALLAIAKLDSAEKFFAAALKLVHVRDSPRQQYCKEVQPLYKLGDVYSKRGQQTGEGGDFVKAAALYNAAIARSDDEAVNGNIVKAIKEVEKSFLECSLDIHCSVVPDDTETHKKQLKEMRNKIKLEMDRIDKELDPYIHEEDSPCVREIEAKRAQAVRQLFENITKQRREFISLLVEGCIGLMGPPPCKYAMIGLGSQATGLVTPYSDLEFAILVEEKSEECLVYFRNLTHYLHLKVVNLGETILPALGIKSLNDFYSNKPQDDWYYDSVTLRGFAFDGSMPKASKTPLGRQGPTNVEHSAELICTPEAMVSILKTDITKYLKKGYHLSTILRNPCLIAGNQDLIDTYMAIIVKVLQADRSQMARQLAEETLQELNIKTHSDKETVTARLIDVKKDLYRFPPLAVDCLALSSCITPTTVWKTIEEMEDQQVISPNNAHHLAVLTSISAELRLRTYLESGGQKENLSALTSMEPELHGQESSYQTIKATALIPVFRLPNEKQLFRYYYTVIPLRRALSELCQQTPVMNSSYDFYDNSQRAQGMMYYELCKYRLAINYYNEALEKGDKTDTQKMLLLVHLGDVWHKTSDYTKAISCYEQALHMHRSIYDQSTAQADMATLLNNLGSACNHLGEYKKAISYLEEAHKMHSSIYGQSTEHSDIARTVNNLGDAWYYLGDYKKAISFYEQALRMNRSIHGKFTVHPDIATSLNNLGSAWHHERCGFSKVIRYLEQALQMRRSIYGQNTAHPDIANSLNNLGNAWNGVPVPEPDNNNKRAIRYHEQALQMYRSIYGQSIAHLDIATSLNNLGQAYSQSGDYRQATSYLEQALEMYKRIYGQRTAHPDIANSLNSLGWALHSFGDHRRAFNTCKEALAMAGKVYQDRNHPLIHKIKLNLSTMEAERILRTDDSQLLKEFFL
ncbi:uncharacterized protein LOC118410466 [Branchiostoma floridae]|uniref:Uncharacterized protein LOC118410466 n=1 Tax=Branchiostoma floridae TaxID=7739 RepID=A0A9J7KQ62_BRAFL|nr:uncharacterized protein LOC118410466 [Branchiostoma floridae]